MLQNVPARLLALTLLALPTIAHAETLPRTITISASGYVSATPNIANISLGVITEADTAKAALDDNTKRFRAVLAAIKGQGVASKDIMTEQFRVSPVYERVKKRSGNHRRIVGFQVQNSANITVRDIQRTGTVIDQATQAGANQIGRIEFTVSKMELKLDFARQEAMRNAIRRAKLFAQEAGARLGAVQTITEQFHSSGRRPRPVYRQAASMAAAPIEAGEQKLGVTVTGVWLLE